ncbi:DNA alkylation repair protein [Candidatus Avelusimicrobium fimicolum]|uniref:DNA alkylation repair protein n=1 Tax=Candidatus Avelusimicrobium fimicolum TaxID=3416216 RepID=UPI003D1313BB
MISPITRSRAEEMLARIKRFATAATKKQMQEKFGICTDNAVGTTVTTLRALVKGLPRPDQDLAEALWQSGIHEARIMASMLADPAQMTREKLDNWASELNSWDICDLCCGNLFSKVKNPLKLAERWIKKEDEFVRRAGFAIICSLSAPRAKTTDEDLIKLLPLIKNHSCDPRPMVHKAVNWALRNIGKKNPRLTPRAVACANEILDLYPDNRSARWVAHNALWELNLPKTKVMVAKRK